MASSAPPLEDAERSADSAVSRAARAIVKLSASIPPVEPLAGALLRARRALGHAVEPAGLFEWWRSRAPGNPRSEMRYRWELTHRRGVPMPEYAANLQDWKAWRPEEEAAL